MSDATQASNVVPKRITYHGFTASTHLSRRLRFCEDRRRDCAHRIEPGGQYVRAVMFPNHDISGYDHPVAMTICLHCALDSELAPLAAPYTPAQDGGDRDE